MQRQKLFHGYTFDFEKKIDLNSPSESREIFDLDFKSKNNFEKFLKNYLFKFMPIAYLEGFKKLKIIVRTLSQNQNW